MKNKGILYLIPTPVSEGTAAEVLSAQVFRVLPALRYFLAENPRTARRFLSGLRLYDQMEALDIETLDKDTEPAQLPGLLKPALEGSPMGLLSEAGCPGVADPGALAVAFAHAHEIPVTPLVGPSSILLALMASGLNGQQFAFHGYLPVDARSAKVRVHDLEVESARKRQTQIVMDTPYRSHMLMERLATWLAPTTRLCVATDLTGTGESVHMRSVGRWRKQLPKIPKTPALFLFQSGPATTGD